MNWFPFFLLLPSLSQAPLLSGFRSPRLTTDPPESSLLKANRLRHGVCEALNLKAWARCVREAKANAGRHQCHGLLCGFRQLLRAVWFLHPLAPSPVFSAKPGLQIPKSIPKSTQTALPALGVLSSYHFSSKAASDDQGPVQMIRPPHVCPAAIGSRDLTEP